MTNSKLFGAGMVLSVFLALAMTLEQVSEALADPAPCDSLGPSASVGACATVLYQCSGATNAVTCGAIDAKHVEQNFPTSCVSNEKTNCNQPSTNCTITVTCSWDPIMSVCTEGTQFGLESGAKTHWRAMHAVTCETNIGDNAALSRKDQDVPERAVPSGLLKCFFVRCHGRG